MKTKSILTIGVLWCMMLNIDAQVTVESIRKEYNSIKSDLAEMMKEDGIPAEYYTVQVKQNLPATGPHFEDVIFYWGENDDDEIYPSHYVRYASTKYNFAVREYYEEYLYDQKGNTLFIYARNPEIGFDDGIIYDFRFYLNKGAAFNVIIKSSTDFGKTFKDEYTGKTVPKQYTDLFKGYLESSKRYKKLFEAIESSNHL